MSESVFRTSTPQITSDPSSKLSEPKPNDKGAEHDLSSIEPVETSGADIAVLNALGVDDMVENLSEEDQSNLSEVKQYVMDILKGKGVQPTKGSIEKTLSNLKGEMGLDTDADPIVVLDRIGGVVKAWKSLSFITNPQEKRSLFMRLANMKSSAEMNKAVFKEMERLQVWQ